MFKTPSLFSIAILIIFLGSPHFTQAQNPSEKDKIIATQYYSGFKEAAGTWNALSSASDGKLYYCLSSQEKNLGGQLYCFNPENNSIAHLGDLTEISGESNIKSFPQGKVHTNFYENDHKLYFATHVGYYEKSDGTEKLIHKTSKSSRIYQGGHIVAFDLKSRTFEILASAPNNEGIVTMVMDTVRNQIYGLTWPRGDFIHYDVGENSLVNLGSRFDGGEAGIPGEDYQVLCRSMFVDPRDGSAYFSNAKGSIFSYNPDIKKIQKMDGVDLRLDYFGKWDTSVPGSMGYGWRRIVWYGAENVAYGIHGGSGYLFKLDTKNKKIQIVERLASKPSREAGMFDQFKYGYLGFKLGPDGETLYYLTGGPIFKNGKIVNDNAKAIAAGITSSSGTWGGRGMENLHLITYNIPQKKYIDHGAIYYEDGTRLLDPGLVHYVNAISFDSKGYIYTCGQYKKDGRVIEDLVRFEDPTSH